MGILEILKHGTAAEIREIGEFLLVMADGPRDAASIAILEAVGEKFRDPKQSDLAARIDVGGKRIGALSDGLRADGMGHAQLIEAELKRRGDTRSLSDYCNDVCGSYLPHSDVA